MHAARQLTGVAWELKVQAILNDHTQTAASRTERVTGLASQEARVSEELTALAADLASQLRELEAVNATILSADSLPSTPLTRFSMTTDAPRI